MPALGKYDKRPGVKKKIDDIPQWQKVFEEVMAEDIAADKKPVRWNFLKDSEGLLNLGLTLAPDIKLMIASGLAKKGIEPDPIKYFRETKINERDYIDGFDDIAKAIDSGVHTLGWSIGDLLFMGIPALQADSTFRDKFNKMMEESQPEAPETWQGDLVSLLVQFGVPASVITKIGARAKSVQKIKNLLEKMGPSKASKIAQRVIRDASIVGATDFIASGPARKLPPLFQKLEDTSGLTGRKKAGADFRNRLRYGSEGMIVGGFFPIIGKTLQQMYKHFARPVGEATLGVAFQGIGKTFSGASYLLARTPGVSQTGSAIAKATSVSTGFALKRMIAPMLVGKLPFRQMPPFKEWRLFSATSPDKYKRRIKKLDNILSWFRAFGKYPKDIEGIGEEVMLHIKSNAKRFDKLMNSIEKRAYKLGKEYEKRYNTGKNSQAYEKMLLDDTVSYIEGTLSKNKTLPKEILSLAYDLRKVMDETLRTFGKNLPKDSRDEVIKSLRKKFTGDLKNYLVKSFATFTNPNYTPDLLIRKEARDWILKNVIGRNPDLKKAANDAYGKTLKGNKILERYADDIVDDILHTAKQGGKNPIKQLQDVGTIHLRNVAEKGKFDYKFLRTGEELPNVIRKLLGEQKDLRSQVLMTVADAVSASYTKLGFDRMAEIGLKNGWLFRSRELARSTYTGAEQITKINNVGMLKTNLQGLYTSPEMVQMFRGAENFLDKAVKTAIWRQMIQLKVGTQIGKTLYSPQTQVRNVTSASFFALWNGHVGGAASVADSMRMVIRDIFREGKNVRGGIDEVEFNKYVEKLVRLGVWDENVVASELRAIMKNLRDGKINSDDEIFERLIKTLPTEKVTKLYAGGDNLWKQYGFEFFKSDLTAALRNIDDVRNFFKLHGRTFNEKHLITGQLKSFDDALDEAAAYMLRNTYPTYSKVPPVIQEIRKIPLFGNFVSFPSEMLRTGVTSINMSLKHIASDNPALRQMGYKQLMGGYMAVKGVGAGLSALSYFLTNSSKEQWQAYSRSGAPTWDKNSDFIALKPWVNGESAYINFSYFSPYDVLERPIQAALSMAAKKKLSPNETEAYVMMLMFDPNGPLAEFLSPFISPAIGIERFQDVSSGKFGPLVGRDGRTADGARIYNPDDTLEDKFNKSLIHILKGVNPGIVNSGSKIWRAAQGDVSGAGALMRLGDELAALFTGTRIVRVDAKRDLKWFASDMLRKNRAADETTKFYKTRDYYNRPPSVMADEFDKMQQQAFKIQKEFFVQIQDFKMLDLDEDAIREILKKARVNSTMINNLMDGVFTPINFSEPRFETKVENLEKVAEQKSEKSKKWGYYVNEEFVYPKDQLEEVKEKWEEREFFPTTFVPTLDENGKQIIKNNRVVGTWEGGYKPEEQGALKDDKGNIMYDEYGQIKKEETFLQKNVPLIQEQIKKLISPLSGLISSNANAAPLPKTSMPNQKLVASAPQINRQTGLTRSESALLSPSEQEIARKT
tara:strand:+ start:1053 stop:5507 length:4455 start_codon:yes stop_codon:yes gene_type:complete